MSESQGGAGRREVAYRLFAAEYDDADRSYSASDEERAPNYVVTPTGARVNRLFVVGVLTEIETVSEDYLRARVVEPTGPFVVYAGQYQPEAMNFLERADPPAFVAVTGKARTFQPEDSDRVYTSVRPESINEVDAATRDRWVLQATERTIERVARAAEAKASGLEGDQLQAALEHHGVDEGLAEGIPIALSHYGTTGSYLAAVRELAVDAARVVAGERDEVEGLAVGPSDGDDADLAALVEREIDVDAIETDDEGPPDLSDAPEPEDDPSPSDDEVEAAVAANDVGGETTTAEDAPDEPADDDGGERDGVSTDSVEESGPVSDQGVEEESEPIGDDTAASTDPAPTTSTDTEDSEEEIGGEDTDDEDLEEFDGEFELDEDERAEIEEEYGTEFQSGTEVDEPGSADIETPDEPEAGGEPVVEGEPAEDDEPVVDDEDEPVPDENEEDATDEDAADEQSLEDAVMDAMTDLDDGDGADRDAVIAEVVQGTDADPGDVEDAIQDALMDGRCYEPDDETLKAI